MGKFEPTYVAKNTDEVSMLEKATMVFEKYISVEPPRHNSIEIRSSTGYVYPNDRAKEIATVLITYSRSKPPDAVTIQGIQSVVSGRSEVRFSAEGFNFVFDYTQR